MPKFVITQPGAVKKMEGGKPSFHKVGAVVEHETLPASLKGKAKPVSDVTESNPVEVSVVNNAEALVSVVVNGSTVTITAIDNELAEMEAAEAEYKALTNKAPDKRWTLETLKEKIEEAKNTGE